MLLTRIEEYLLEARRFYKQDQQYFELNDSSFDEKLIMDLFVNATNFDLDNIERFVKKRTEMLKEKSVQCETACLGEFLGNDIVVKISKNKSNLEGPYRFDIIFKKDDEKFNLPRITFGRIKNQMYIYSLQGERKKQENKLAKRIDRYFRKANKGVDMEDEILSQISTNALISCLIRTISSTCTSFIPSNRQNIPFEIPCSTIRFLLG